MGGRSCLPHLQSPFQLSPGLSVPACPCARLQHSLAQAFPPLAGPLGRWSPPGEGTRFPHGCPVLSTLLSSTGGQRSL